MAKKTTYNDKSREELVLELAKESAAVRSGKLEKLKTGKAQSYRTARKNVARILTAMRAAK